MNNNKDKTHIIPDYESPIRSIIAEVHSVEYRRLKSFQEAQEFDDAVMIMEGDWGGIIYLTCPTNLVKCSENELHQLLSELDTLCWACNKGQGNGLYYERRKLGERVAGGMGGGLVTQDIWIHPKLKSLRLEGKIHNIITFHSKNDDKNN